MVPAGNSLLGEQGSDNADDREGPVDVSAVSSENAVWRRLLENRLAGTLQVLGEPVVRGTPWGEIKPLMNSSLVDKDDDA